jgi:hypothetical protein
VDSASKLSCISIVNDGQCPAQYLYIQHFIMNGMGRPGRSYGKYYYPGCVERLKKKTHKNLNKDSR